LQSVLVKPDVNKTLVRFTQTLLEVHPSLEAGVPEDSDLNAACLKVFQNWTSKLQSHSEHDSLVLATSKYHYSPQTVHTHSDELCLMFSASTSGALYLKEFVNSSLPYELVLEAMRLVNCLACGALEIWTPEVIRDLYSYTSWYGSDTDVEFEEQFEDMNQEAFNPEEHEVLLPSDWQDRMATAGFLPVGRKTTMNHAKLDAFKSASDARQTTLVLAMQECLSLLALPPVHSTEDQSHDKVEAAFVFLWDDSAFLADALDEVVNERYNCGESSENQCELTYNHTTTLEHMVNDVKFVDRLVEFQSGVGRLFQAMLAFCEPAKTQEPG
jgi:hypothetical protein